MPQAEQTLYDKEYFDYLLNRSSFRKYIRGFYLRNIKKYCRGKTIDFGCGVGELLKILPAGSVGFEINKVAVDHCVSMGLDVRLYSPENDNYQLADIRPGSYTTFTMNHVLEHLTDSRKIIEILFSTCNRLGIERIVFTVPGLKGYKTDPTHETFITVEYLKDHGLLDNKYYKLYKSRYFPVNNKLFSHYFTHNELRLVFDKII